MKKAFLFDMDGVLIESEGLSVSIALSFFKEKGVTVTKKEMAPYLGAGEAVFFQGPAKLKGIDIDLEEAGAYFKRVYLERIGQIKFSTQSRDVIRHLNSLGFKCALCSSAPHWKVLANIKAINLEESDFAVLVSGEEVRHNKPSGEIYTTAREKLGLSKDECLVVEDSLNGLKSAADAGLESLGIAGTLDCQTLRLSGAAYIASDLGVLLKGKTMSETIEKLEGRKLFGTSYIKLRDESLFSPSIEDMIEEAKKTRLNAYTPYSRFKVGACIKSAATGKIYSGCNVENSSFGATICAERNAVLHAIAQEGTIGVETLVVVSDDDPPSPPCAACLQVLAEFSAPDTRVILVPLKGERKDYLFSELLPSPFIFPSERK